jgi:hypothetical protein
MSLSTHKLGGAANEFVASAPMSLPFPLKHPVVPFIVCFSAISCRRPGFANTLSN